MGKLGWFMSRTQTLTSPPREGEPAGTLASVTSHTYCRVQKLGRWPLHWRLRGPVQIHFIIRDCIFPPILLLHTLLYTNPCIMQLGI